MKTSMKAIALVAVSVSLTGCFLIPGYSEKKAAVEQKKAEAAAKKAESDAKIDEKKEAIDEKKAEVDEKTGPAKEAQKCEKLRNPQVAIEEENALGGAIAVSFAGKGGLFIEPGKPKSAINDLTLYVNRVGKNLAAQSTRPNLEWTFAVVDSPSFNAYSAPGGYVMVTKGLLKQVENEAQLAGVLSHEIAHVTQRHALKVYGNVKANQCQAALLAKLGSDKAKDNEAMKEFAADFEGALGAPGGNLDLNKAGAKLLTLLTDKVVGELTTKGLAHGDEFDADRLAAELMMNAGYSPKEYVGFLGKIPQDGGAFSNHPKTDVRKTKLAEWQTAVKAKPNPLSIDPDSTDLKAVPLKDELAVAKK